MLTIVAIIAVASIAMIATYFISKKYGDKLSNSYNPAREELWTNIIITISTILMMAFVMYALFT